MRVVLQRVTKASVTIDGSCVAEIGRGLLVLVGVEDGDGVDDMEWLTGKIARLRIFGDENGQMNKSLLDTHGDALVVSQFTLHASTKKGNRPSFIKAARPEIAMPLYEQFVHALELQLHKKVATGVFGADMKVALLNDGPVTLILDTKDK